MLPIPAGLCPSHALECDVSSSLVRLHDGTHQKNQTHRSSGQPPVQQLILKGHWIRPETEEHASSHTEYYPNGGPRGQKLCDKKVKYPSI